MVHWWTLLELGLRLGAEGPERNTKDHYLGVPRKRACWFGFGNFVYTNDDNCDDFGKSSLCYDTWHSSNQTATLYGLNEFAVLLVAQIFLRQ